MSLEIDESLNLSAARSVRLAGREFWIAPLSLRQILAIADYVPKLSGIGLENLSGRPGNAYICRDPAMKAPLPRLAMPS